MVAYRPDVKIPDHNRIMDENFRNQLYEQVDWLIFVQDNCEWSRKALELLLKEKQKNVDIHDVIKEQKIQRCYSLGQAYTPIIYYKNKQDKEHKLLGGFPELEWFFKRTLIDPANIKKPGE